MSVSATLVNSLCGLVLIAFTFPISLMQEASSGQSSTPQQPSEKQDSNKKIDETQLFMQAKLTKSQKVLEGLLTENFAMIRDGAKQMKKISEAAHWQS